MKKIIAIAFLLFCSTFSFSQEGNLWRTFFEQAILLNENSEYAAAEENFRKAQQLLLDEFGLNNATNATYCHILYRRAQNLFLMDEMQDSSFVCYKELYDLSKTPVDSVSGEWFRTESTIMLSSIYYNKGKIRECCELLENEKQMIDKLDLDTRLAHKYYFYKNLAITYDHLLVSPISGKERDYWFMNSQYVIVRDGAFYQEYIAVYEELVNLSTHFNKGKVEKLTEDLLLLASHYRIPDDDYHAFKTYERAFSLWDNIEDHNSITYLHLCKSYLMYCNKSTDQLRIKDKIAKEFDSIVLGEIESLSIINIMEFLSVRMQDKSLDNSQKEIYVNELCDYLANLDNYEILILICGYTPTDKTMESINNIKILINYLSLCSIYYYEQDNYLKADLLLNKARFSSFLLPDGDKLLMEELNNAIAKSAESIGDMETYYMYKSVNFTCNTASTCNTARGITPTLNDWLSVSNYGDVNNRIAKIQNGINLFSHEKYDKSLLEFYLRLAEAYIESNDYTTADENIAIADSITKLMTRDGDVIPGILMRDLFLDRAKSALHKRDFVNAKFFANKSIEFARTIEAVDLLAELSANNKTVIDSIICNQYYRTATFIHESYPILSEKERISFSQSTEFQWFSNIPRYADRYANDTLLLSMAYNSALISKGTNVSVSTAIIKTARESDEEETNKVLTDYLQLTTKKVNDTSERVRENRSFYLEVLEKEMQRSSGVTAQYLSKYFGNWEDISLLLSEKEIAIEFVEYVPWGEPGEDEPYLGALYITKGCIPQILRMCKVTEIDSLNTHFKQDGEQGLAETYDIIWHPILKEFHNINKVWFAPSVHLFQTNIESALPDSIDAYRVSSTRNIITMNDIPDFSEIALFGGLNYDDKDTLVNVELPDLTAYNIIRGSNIEEERVGLAYLKGSLSEVYSAQSILSTINNSIQLFVDKEGTEERFKSLSGTGISLLHIATHGFYIKNGDNVTNVGNRVMRKSGLFMSGAKAVWKGLNERYTGDDGILLSEEIENLDFSKLNLVVLSACGTGLGNPTNDGVYGLQRAFKKAGAQTIIMSLWNVDDNATALMMKTFYQELVKTNSKHQAFRKAQNAVREFYEEPYYWTAFIVLD